ncbi:hypothetical protein Tco_0567051 [Tanacetum coccineum]
MNERQCSKRDIRPVNDQVPFAEVQLTAQHNVPTNEQQHTEQSKPIYDTYLLEKVDSNNTPDSTNMCYRGGEIDQDAEQYQAKSPLLKAELVKSKEMIEKEMYNELSRSHPIMPKVREYVLAKPHHVIAPGSSRNSQKVSYGSNDMAHNHYLEEARKKAQERNRNLKPKVNSRAKVQSPKTKNINKSVEPKSHTQKPGRQIAIGQRFSPKKSSAVHEKSNSPRSFLRWKPTGRIFKIVGLRWIPTGKMFTSKTTKVDCETSNGSNEDISNPHECEKTLDVSAGTLNLSAGLPSMTNDVCSHQFRPRSSMTNEVCSHQFRPRSSMTIDICSHQFRPCSSTTYGVCLQTLISPPLRLVPQPPSPTPNVPPTKNDWDLVFCPMMDKYFNPSPSVVQHVLVAVVQEPVIFTVEEDDHGIEVAHMDNDLDLGGVPEKKANQEAKERWSIEIYFRRARIQLADIFSKPLRQEKLEFLM